jgi:hypothetical protein
VLASDPETSEYLWVRDSLLECALLWVSRWRGAAPSGWGRALLSQCRLPPLADLVAFLWSSETPPW